MKASTKPKRMLKKGPANATTARGHGLHGSSFLSCIVFGESVRNTLAPGLVPETAVEVDYFFWFPWSAMGRTDKPDRIGFNIGVQDDDGGGRRDHALYWTGNPRRPFSDESAFGILVLDP